MNKDELREAAEGFSNDRLIYKKGYKDGYAAASSGPGEVCECGHIIHSDKTGICETPGCLCKELTAVAHDHLAAERDKWLKIAQRLFKERQTLLHGHTYDLPSDDVILEATILQHLKSADSAPGLREALEGLVEAVGQLPAGAEHTEENRNLRKAWEAARAALGETK